jgi:hypothetical protein
MGRYWRCRFLSRQRSARRLNLQDRYSFAATLLAPETACLDQDRALLV